MSEYLNIGKPNTRIVKSPFVRYLNERVVYDGRKTPTNINAIVNHVQIGNITNDDYAIIRAVYELQYASSRLITQHLVLNGIEVTQSKVQNRLKFLNKLGVISRFKFDSDEGGAIARAYCLAKGGKVLLVGRNYPCDWKATDSCMDLPDVKSILARNQVLACYRNSVSNMDSYDLKPSFTSLMSGQKIEPHLQMTVNNLEKMDTLIFEVVRTYDGWMELLIKKLRIYQEYFENYGRTNPNTIPPQLIIVAETDAHIAEIVKLAYIEKLKVSGIQYFYTTDIRVLDDLKTSLLADVVSENKVQLQIRDTSNMLNIKEEVNNHYFMGADMDK
jgi:DNA-binding Lrp family transcriptional regulator